MLGSMHAIGHVCQHFIAVSSVLHSLWCHLLQAIWFRKIVLDITTNKTKMSEHNVTHQEQNAPSVNNTSARPNSRRMYRGYGWSRKGTKASRRAHRQKKQGKGALQAGGVLTAGLFACNSKSMSLRLFSTCSECQQTQRCWCWNGF